MHARIDLHFTIFHASQPPQSSAISASHYFIRFDTVRSIFLLFTRHCSAWDIIGMKLACPPPIHPDSLYDLIQRKDKAGIVNCIPLAQRNINLLLFHCFNRNI